MSWLHGVNSLRFHTIGQRKSHNQASGTGGQITWQCVGMYHPREERRNVNNWEDKVFTILPVDNIHSAKF